MRDDLSGPMNTAENALPPERQDSDRREQMLVETFMTDAPKAQRMLDNRNALEDAGEVVARDHEAEGGEDMPLPPTGQPAELPEGMNIVNFRAGLARQPGGEELVREWGSGFATELPHAFAGLEKLREAHPTLSNLVDSLPMWQQHQLAPELLRFAAQYNRRYAYNLGERTTVSAPRGGGYSGYSSAPTYEAPRMTGGNNASAEADRLTGQAVALRNVPGKNEEVRELIRRAEALRARAPGANNPIVGTFGRTL